MKTIILAVFAATTQAFNKSELTEAGSEVDISDAGIAGNVIKFKADAELSKKVSANGGGSGGNPGDLKAKEKANRTKVARQVDTALQYAVRNNLISPDLISLTETPFVVKRYSSQEECDALGRTHYSHFEWD